MTTPLFPERRIVTCACGNTNCEMAVGQRDGVVYFTSTGVAEAVEHDRQLRRRLAVEMAKVRELFARHGLL